MPIQKIKILLIVLLIPVFNLSATISGRSFFTVPTLFRPASYEQIAATRQQLQINDLDNRHHFSVTPFGGTSLDGDQLAQYFLPIGNNVTCKTTLMVGEVGSDAANNNRVDLLAHYFKVVTAALPSDGGLYDKTDYYFQSQLSFAPKHTFWGVNLNYRYHLSRYLDKGYWVEIAAPLVRVENDLGLREEIINAGSGAVPTDYFSNMVAAFKQADWNYGKIDGARSKVGLADLQLRAGYVYVNEKHYFLNTYFGILLPTGDKPTCEYLFEPIIGSGGRLGVFSGGSAGVRIWAKCERAVYWMVDTAGTYFFANNQLRSLDLLGRPLSRYLPVFLSRDATQTNPGINSFTLPVEVAASSVRDLNTAFVYKQGGLHAELGYHFYGRPAEELSLLHSLGDSLVIASDLHTDISSGAEELIYDEPSDNANAHFSRNHASIGRYLQVKNDQNSSGSDTYLPLTDAELDLNSGAHPAMLTHAFYGAIGYHWQETNYPLFMALGGAWETGSDNAVLAKMMVWCKLDLSF